MLNAALNAVDTLFPGLKQLAKACSWLLARAGCWGSGWRRAPFPSPGIDRAPRAPAH